MIRSTHTLRHVEALLFAGHPPPSLSDLFLFMSLTPSIVAISMLLFRCCLGIVDANGFEVYYAIVGDHNWIVFSLPQLFV
jgi:hypothetical protein